MSNEVLRFSSLEEVADHVPDRSSTYAAVLWPPIVVGLAYYLGCLAGFALRFPDSGISFFWPPNGILTAALLLTPTAWWPRLMVGALVAHGIAHTEDGIDASAWLMMFFGNALQALLAAAVVRRFATARETFSDLRRIVIFLIGSCWIAPAVASLAVASVYVSLGWAPDFFEAWSARAVSNSIAMLTVVPSLVLLWPYVRDRRIGSLTRIAEFGSLLVCLILVQAAVLPVDSSGGLRSFVALYAPTPLLLWGTVRFGVAGLSFALLWTALLTIFTALSGHGPLSGGSAADTVLAVQMVLTANAIPMMLLAGVLLQRRIEHNALVDVERQNSAILRALPDQLYLLTRDGRCLGIYPQTHASARPPLARAGDDLQDLLPPDLTRAVLRTIASVGSNEAPVLEFTRVVDGEPQHLEASFTAIDADRVLAVIRDVTSRWRSERELRESQGRFALASAAGGIGVWELRVQDGRVRTEGSLKQLLGYREGDIPDTLADWVRLIVTDDIDLVMARLNAVLTGQATVFDADIRLRHKDGSFRIIASRGSVSERVDGRPSRITGTYADVTERRENARLLREAHDAVVRMNRIAEVSEVSASIAHEVHQPLTAIAANAMTGLHWTESDPSARRLHLLFKDVLEDSQRAAHVIDRTRRMFTNQPAPAGDVNLNDVARQTLDVVSPRAHELHVRMELLLEEDLPVVYGDAVQLQQVLMNLIINAMDAMRDVEASRRRLTVETWHGKRHVLVSVSDTGPGFGADGPAHVFEAFFTTKAGGTGMGLAIARSIVQAHGGRIWAVANAARGATFRVKLPRRVKHAARPRRLLVVDDDRSMRRSLARLIQSWGHQVVVASGPQPALAALDAFEPDVAFIDLSIGEGSGLDLARTLRERFPARPWKLYVMTADNDETVRQACLTVFDGFLLKPAQLSELQRLLN